MPVLKQNDVFAGRYLLIQLLGEGGFSEVWKAMDEMADNAVVAIKIYAPGRGLDDYGLRQFRNEFSITHTLSHPHLLKVYHFDISDGSPYLIMPFCPYGSLTNELGQQGVFTEKQVALVMDQIGAALQEVHQQDPSIIHQDIKPDNILLLQKEYYMLADFGISSRLRHTMRKATGGFQTLTVAYAPPERFDRHPSAAPASDIFSLGVTLYEMCTNTVPWEGAGGQCLLKGAHIPALPAAFSPELSRILEACMAVEPAKRPTAAEIQQRGKHFLETGQWLMPKKKKAKSSGRSLVPLLLAAVAALVVLAGFWLYNEQGFGFTSSVGTGVTAAALPEKETNPLEDKLKNMEAELMKTNQRLLLQDSINKLLVENKDNQLAREKELLANRENALAVVQTTAAQANAARDRKTAAANLSQKLQYSLNQISDPKNSREQRSGWKQEALARFASGAVRVLDESGGEVKEYRAGIFLTLLLTSPHQVEVLEVKTDSSNKITELRLSKQPLQSAM